jgi:CheY-like chemotaxis protein
MHPAPPQLALVVDDQEYNRVVLADLLGQLGYAAHATGDGAEALQLATRHDFDVAFLDYDLPGLSGLDVARGLRELPSPSSRAHIFATTAFNTPAKQQECLDAGMDAFLGKPVTLERLRKALAGAGLATQVAPVAAPPALPPPADGLANLRLLATKKQVAFMDEVALYLSEMQVEIEQLTDAVNRRHPADAAHYAHRLCGRCSFIYERELARLLRRIEEAAAKGDWSEVGRLCTDLPAFVGDLRLRMASSGPAAPPA